MDWHTAHVLFSVVYILSHCDGHVQSQARIIDFNFLPKTARRGLANAQWILNESPASIAREMKDFYNATLLDHMIGWSQAEKNSSQCRDSLEHFGLDLMQKKAYALQALDATGKLESGLLRGNYKWNGRYFQCRSIQVTEFHGKWCSVVVGKKNPITNSPIGITLAVCLPDTCSEEDIYEAAALLKIFAANATVVVDCPVQPTQWQPTDIVFVVLLSILVILVIVGTSLEVYIEHKNKRVAREGPIDDAVEISQCQRFDSNEMACWKQAILSFSIIRNTKTLFSVTKTPATIDCLHGLRFFSMCWVVLGHTFVFSVIHTVDSFFFISGLLVAYLSLKDSSRLTASRVPVMYLQRYLRLTPAYAFVILFLVGFYSKIGDGPGWPATFHQSCENCQKYWWTNLLYINNLHPASLLNECMALGWYLANDMQFFVLAPISLLVLKRSRTLGMSILLFGLFSSMLVTGVISSHYKLQPLPVVVALLLGTTSQATPSGAGLASDLGEAPPMTQSDQFWSDTYAKPWCRIGVYIVGMMTGYVLAVTKRRIQMAKIFAAFGWAVAAVLNLSVLYGTWKYVHTVTPMADSLAAFYDAMCRPIWACGLAWVVIACATGYGGPVNAFLSWKALVPLSRLTYCVYLVHPMVISAWFDSQEVDVHYSTTQFSFYFIGMCAVFCFLLPISDSGGIVLGPGILTMAHGFAYALSMLVEAPFINLFKVATAKYASPPREERLLDGVSE